MCARYSLFGLALVLLLAATPASASVTDETEIEVYLGWYSSDAELLEDSGTIGVRWGDNINRRFNIAASLGYFSSSTTQTSGTTTSKFDYNAWLVDVSFGGNFFPGKNVRPILFAGIGFALVDGDITQDGPPLPDLVPGGLADGSLTFHVGGGFKWDVAKRTYIRVDVLGRWFTQRDENAYDAQLDVGVGWKF